MKTRDLPEVIGIDEPGVYRYIIACIMTLQGREKREILRAGLYDSKTRRVTYQSLHVQLNIEHGDNIIHQNVGSGLLEVHDHVIDIFGTKGTYGVERDRELTVAMLRRAFPDRHIRNRT